MREIIVKVQMPLYSSDNSAGILVYDENKTIMNELPIRSEKELRELKKMMKKGVCGRVYGGMKNYFYAKKDGKGLILTGLAPEQDW